MRRSFDLAILAAIAFGVAVLIVQLSGCASPGFSGMKPDDASIPYKALQREMKHRGR